MKYIRIFFLLFLIILFPRITNASESITNFSSDISINSDASVDIKEKIIYDFGSEQRRGIIREIPLVYTNNEGKKFKIDLNVINVTDENEISYKYRVSETNGKKIVKVGEEDKYITGQHIYEINYIAKGVITYFSDHDELFWNITGNEWTVPINTATSTINLNIGINELPKIVCYADCETKIVSNSEIHVETTQALEPGKGLKFAVGFPKNLVSVIEPQEVVDFWQTPLGKLFAVVLAIVAFLYYAVSPFLVFLIWLKYGRDPKVAKPVRAWFDPPKDSHGKSLSPAEVGTLVDEQADNKEISATIVDLAVGGFIKIKEIKSGKNYEFTLLKKNYKSQDLNDNETKLLDEFFKTGNNVSTTDLKNTFYKTAAEIKSDLYTNLVHRGFFPRNPDKIRTAFYIVAFIVLITGNFLLAISLFIFGRVMPKKTLYGAQSQNVALGLKNFLTSYERQLKFQADKWFLFEKLLPFAIVFGVEDIWAKRFEHLEVNPPSWYEGSNTNGFNSMVFTHNLSSLTSNFSSISSAPTTTTSSSGFSSGFSSGGGGFGGGGGSSW